MSDNKAGEVRFFKPDNKLARTITDPTGMLLGTALNKAHTNLDKVRDQHMAALDAKMDELAEMAPAALLRQSSEDAARIYQIARDILGEAGLFGMKSISRATHSLCELMAAGPEHRQLWAGVSVHVSAITVLRRAGSAAGGPGVEAMLGGLEKISRARV